MINDKLIIKISLISFLLLFILVFYVENTSKLSKTNITSLKFKDIEKRVVIEAIVVKQTLVNNNLFFTIKDSSGEINAIIFNFPENINTKNSYIFEGKILKYNDKLELIVEKFY